jgi:hypothetical protein
LGLLLQAKWIWLSDDLPSSTSLLDKRYFSRSFKIEAAQKIECAEVTMTANPGFELFVNDQSIETGDDYKK